MEAPMSWCEKFIDAFNTHQVEPMLAITSPDVKWEDISGHIEFEGRDGVKNMVELTLMAIPDCKFTYHGGMKNGNDYVVEWTMSGTAFGTEFACRGASVGETDDGGKILHNRDYWDSRSFPEMPAGPVNPELEDLQAKHA
jgi:ketosteroid isomerase-like protein